LLTRIKTKECFKNCTLAAGFFKLVRLALLAVFVSLPLLSCSAAGIESGEPSLGTDNPGEFRDNTPVVQQVEQPGILVAQSSSAVIDYSNYRNGYICAKTMVEGRFKVLVDAPDGAVYQFTIDQPGQYITIGLSRGNGHYIAAFWQNTTDNLYASMFVVQLDVEIENQMLPFLYPNQYVFFTPDDRAVRLSQEVTEGATSEIEAIEAIYLWCVMNLSYDYNKARTVQPGYLPDNNDTLDTLNGICFDYAVLCTSMMRAQRMPTRIEIGYIGDVYHAWLSIYTSEHGMIRKVIVFDPDTWVLLDPTMDSSSKTPLGLGPLFIKPEDYQPMFYY